MGSQQTDEKKTNKLESKIILNLEVKLGMHNTPGIHFWYKNSKSLGRFHETFAITVFVKLSRKLCNTYKCHVLRRYLSLAF